jgi:hypothetical protein
MSYSNPSINPADQDTLAGAFSFAMQRAFINTDGMLPAQVIAYDRTTNRVQVQLLITLLTTDGVQLPRPQIASLPVLLLGGGGYLLSFPLQTGNLGWVAANDRDISLFLQSYSQSPPNTERVKSFSDGLFIPDAMTGYTISSGDEANVVLQNLDGSNKVSLNDSFITLESTTRININAPSVNIDLGSPLNVLTVEGSIFATGTITP